MGTSTVWVSAPAGVIALADVVQYFQPVVTTLVAAGITWLAMRGAKLLKLVVA